MEIGEKLRTLRNEKDYTLKQLAVLTGISISFISDIENGRRIPSLPNLEKLARVLGVSLYDFHGTNVVSSVNYGRDNDEKVISINKDSASYGEIAELFDTLHKRPEMKTLLSALRHSTKEDIERTIKIIEALNKK